MLRQLLLSFFLVSTALAQQPQKAVRIAVAGIVHGHSAWIFNRANKGDIDFVGIYEPNKEVVAKYKQRYKLKDELFFDDLEKMLDQTHPEGVAAFGPIADHIKVVRACAPRKIHVMVEKPLATSPKDAQEMNALAKKYDIKVLTNYETSWYSSNQHLMKLKNEGKLGDIKKIMVNDGHQGPKEIGVSNEFFEWLTDPIKNGAGALTDFGCYGANLSTWMMNGQRPISVTAITHQNKPQIYPKVEDEATIILQYPSSQTIIQGSWNWTFARKDMEVYGTKGYAVAVNKTQIRQRFNEKDAEETLNLSPRPAPYEDPFDVFAQTIRGKIQLEANDLYELPNNLLVVEILEAAKKSAQTGKTVKL